MPSIEENPKLQTAETMDQRLGQYGERSKGLLAAIPFSGRGMGDLEALSAFEGIRKGRFLLGVELLATEW